MKLVLATPLYPPEAGGPATYAKILFEALPREGIEVILIKFSEVRAYPTLVRHVVYFFKVLRASWNADLIMVQDTISCGVPAACAARVLRKPFIVRVPGDYAWEQGRQRAGVIEDLDTFQHTRHGWRVELLRWLQRWVVKSADLVIVPSEYFRNIVSTWGVSPDRLRVIYHGMEPSPAVTPPAMRPEGLVAVSSGRLVPWKGFAVLIRMFAELPNWHLVIVGDGPERVRLEEIAKNTRVAERIIFTGTLPRAEVLGWCSVADAFVLNSSFESFSFQVAEAMSTGTPVIATAIGSIPELIHDGKEGMLCAPNDAMCFREALAKVAAHDEGVRARTEAAKEKIQQFSLPRMIRETTAALTAL